VNLRAPNLCRQDGGWWQPLRYRPWHQLQDPLRPGTLRSVPSLTTVASLEPLWESYLRSIGPRLDPAVVRREPSRRLCDPGSAMARTDRPRPRMARWSVLAHVVVHATTWGHLSTAIWRICSWPRAARGIWLGKRLIDAVSELAARRGGSLLCLAHAAVSTARLARSTTSWPSCTSVRRPTSASLVNGPARGGTAQGHLRHRRHRRHRQQWQPLARESLGRQVPEARRWRRHSFLPSSGGGGAGGGYYGGGGGGGQRGGRYRCRGGGGF